MRRATFTALLLCTVALPVAAQRNEVTVEGSVFRGTVGYARRTAPRLLIGLELGFGFPQIDRTFSPEKDAANPVTGTPDFEEYLHVGVFVRLEASENFELDTGLRGAVADLWPCTASDCWPSLFRGAYVQPMVGWRRVKLGARLTAGWIDETQEPAPDGTTFLVGLAPLLVRATFPW